MAAELQVTVTGLSSLNEFTAILDRVPVAASRALNRAAARARTESSRRVRDQLAFTARYLSGRDGKIALIPSTKNKLEARLTAASDARSLARFVTSSSKRQGVRVTVAPGGTKRLPGAFLIGVGDNTLLAIRSKTKPRTAFRPREFARGLWSLYGPSVAQALIARNEQTGVWPSMEAEIIANLEEEFLRLMALDKDV